ncbi:sensor histidine kinase [Actinoplanes lobatus]|uniref:histidine kinase n=1 Tax=Actinoplanes lobatus TaxID=113568 RepID=A0A7W7ML23_9ACTN|nr:histidine kinase [Actinoplanes lobatus]MBB4753931.1 signal transduction histidine kinase [Actinoplanes lobatus]
MGRSPTEYRWLWPSALAADPSGPLPARRSTRDWIVDVHCFVLALGFTILITNDLVGPDPSTAVEWLGMSTWSSMTDGVVSAVAAFGLWWRRRFLMPLAILVGLLSFVSIASWMTQLIMVFTVAVHRRFGVLAPYMGLTVVGNAVFALMRPELGVTHWETFGWGVAMATIAALWGMLVRSRRLLMLTWRERAERAEAEQQLRVSQARVLERTRIAREMHDVLAHRISLLSLHAGALEFRPGAPPEEIAGAAAVVRANAHQALQDLRTVIGVLRAGQSDEQQAPERPQPTLSALPALADESRAAGNRVRLEMTIDPETVPVAAGRDAYRIIQEGLTNVRKHAPGASVHVVVGGEAGDGMTIGIRNPMPVTVPTAPIPGTGVGLIGLGERARLAGGRLTHGRDDDHFMLTAWLPWPA